MKLKFVFLPLVLFISACAPPEPVSGQINHIQEKKDPFTGEISYRTKYFEMIPAKGEIYCPFSIMLRSSGMSDTPTLIVNYRNSDWFFLTEIAVKTSLGQIIPLKGSQISRDVFKGYVEEYVAFSPTQSELASMGLSNTLEVRFSGSRIGSSNTNMAHGNLIWAIRQFFAMQERSASQQPK